MRPSADTPIDTLRNVLRWHLVRACASTLPPAFEDEHFAFYGRTLAGQQEQQPRWKRLVQAASSDIGEAVAQRFVRVTFHRRPRHASRRWWTICSRRWVAPSGPTVWMTEPTRQEALTKLAGFTYKIGYPDEWRDYSSLRLDRSNYLANRLAASAFEMRRQLGRLGKPMDEGEWAMPAHVVNAYYHPLRNQIVFPAGIPPAAVLLRRRDDAVNYGGIGTVIGHDITHGFDDTGSRLDDVGALPTGGRRRTGRSSSAERTWSSSSSTTTRSRTTST